MKKAKKIGGIGQLLMIIGSVLYIVELLGYEFKALTATISVIYAVAIVLMVAGWFGVRKARKTQENEAA